ncbi:MAG: PQQ-like beta-propeller repeat protein [Planctomycetales bacterium]|nr:PQQ-like beta-propeller repeat protein [Planctomycetales bacterium]
MRFVRRALFAPLTVDPSPPTTLPQGERGVRQTLLIAFTLLTSLTLVTSGQEKPKSASERNEAYAAGSSPKTTRTGEDWPWFLGPRHTGIAGETGLLEKWPEKGPPMLWSMRVGTGYSAPSVRGNLLLLHHREGDESVVECIAADTGEFVWRHAYPTDFEDPFGYNNGPRCSPLLTKDRCYTFGAEGRLSCLDLKTGREIWKRDTASEFRVPQAFFGVGATPTLEGNLLITILGALPNAGMVAFDATTGKTVWQNVAQKNFDDGGVRYQRDIKMASYSSPLAVTIHGKRHILAFMRPGLVSVDPQTGDLNFSYFFRSSVAESVNAARPVVVDDLVFLSAAYETGAALLRVKSDGKSFDVAWKDLDAMQTHWSTTIEHGGYLYGFSGRHEPGSTFRCIEMKTGKLRWATQDVNAFDEADPKAGLGKTEPKFYGRGSAILADGKFIVLGERGLLALVKVNPNKFEEISRVKFPQMGYPAWTAPVLSRKRLYLRDENSLLCLDLAK